MTDRSKSPARFKWHIGIAIILVLVLLSFSIPQVRATLSTWLGLSVASSNQMPITAVTLVAVTSPTSVVNKPAVATSTSLTGTNGNITEIPSSTPSQPVVSTTLPADLSQLAALAGWDILTPNHLPEGYQYQSAFFDTNNKMLILTYLVTRPLPGATDPSLTSSETITLLESQKNDFIPMQIAPSTNVTDIQVNGLPAAYTVGGWDTQFVKDAAQPNGGKMVSSWRNDLPVKNLYWRVGKIYLALMTADGTVSQQDLLDMASSIGK
jgi:hypothetical protein